VKLTRAQLENILGGNWFAKHEPFDYGMAVPPGTNVSVRAPRDATSEGEIRFRHSLCTLVLTTSVGYSAETGVGPYRELMGVTQDEAQERFWYEDYLVRGEVTFTRCGQVILSCRSSNVGPCRSSTACNTSLTSSVCGRRHKTTSFSRRLLGARLGEPFIRRRPVWSRPWRRTRRGRHLVVTVVTIFEGESGELQCAAAPTPLPNWLRIS
jgi:hypothetical protein